MESLIIDKEKLVKRLSVIITELNAIKRDIEKDAEFNKVLTTENVKESKHFIETAAVKTIQKKKLEDGYTSYDNPAGLPDMGF